MCRGIKHHNFNSIKPHNTWGGGVAAYNETCRKLDDYLIDTIALQLQFDRGSFLISYFEHMRHSSKILKFYEKIGQNGRIFFKPHVMRIDLDDFFFQTIILK